jgi:hypothetical protein
VQALRQKAQATPVEHRIYFADYRDVMASSCRSASAAPSAQTHRRNDVRPVSKSIRRLRRRNSPSPGKPGDLDDSCSSRRFLLSPLIAPNAYAQNQTGRLTLTINDTTGGSLPSATVTVTGLDPANKELKIAPQQTSESGIVNFDLRRTLCGGGGVLGFETSQPREVRVRAGNNNTARMTIVLALARLKDEVVVGRDQQAAGSDRASTFGSLLTRDQIDQLSDDPAIARQQLEDFAGPGAQILIDSFEVASFRTNRRSARSGSRAINSQRKTILPGAFASRSSRSPARGTSAARRGRTSTPARWTAVTRWSTARHPHRTSTAA